MVRFSGTHFFYLPVMKRGEINEVSRHLASDPQASYWEYGDVLIVDTGSALNRTTDYELLAEAKSVYERVLKTSDNDLPRVTYHYAQGDSSPRIVANSTLKVGLPQWTMHGYIRDLVPNNILERVKQGKLQPERENRSGQSSQTILKEEAQALKPRLSLDAWPGFHYIVNYLRLSGVEQEQIAERLQLEGRYLFKNA